MKEFILKLKNLLKPIEQNSDGYHTFDELYEHRIALFIFLLNKFSKEAQMPVSNKIDYNHCWKSLKNSDDSIWDGWFVAGIDDKITYHLPIKYWSLLKVHEIEKGKWDGHTSKDVIERLLEI